MAATNAPQPAAIVLEVIPGKCPQCGHTEPHTRYGIGCTWHQGSEECKCWYRKRPGN